MYVKFNIMIQIPIPLRDEFKDKVKNFCSDNNIEWGTVYSECWNEGVSGTQKDIKLVEDYVSKLEEERLNYRKSKSFWWRLWH